jgi:hypothetical protein
MILLVMVVVDLVSVGTLVVIETVASDSQSIKKVYDYAAFGEI